MAHIIDLAAEPFIPEGWSLDHNYGGWYSQYKSTQLVWSPDAVELYHFPGQKDGKGMRGIDLNCYLYTPHNLSANVLDYLLANQELIPEAWKEECRWDGIYFWGTFYKLNGFKEDYRRDERVVRCLCYSKEKGWYWGSHRLNWTHRHMDGTFHGSVAVLPDRRIMK